MPELLGLAIVALVFGPMGGRRGNRVTLQDVPMSNSAPLKLSDLTGLRHGSTAMTTTEITR